MCGERAGVRVRKGSTLRSERGRKRIASTDPLIDADWSVLSENGRLISSALPAHDPERTVPLPLSATSHVVHAMKRTTSTSRTPPSPTTTTYSGISNYQNSTFQPRSPPNQSANYPPLDSVLIAKAHFDELHKYLASYLAKGVCFRFIRRPCTIRGITPRQYHPGWALPPPPGLLLAQRRVVLDTNVRTKLAVMWPDPCPAQFSPFTPLRTCKLSNIGTTETHSPHTPTVSRTLDRRVR